MKLYLISILFCLHQFAYSQDWCHQGSQWTYNFYTFGNSGFMQYTNQKDTTVQLQSCKKLSSIFVTSGIFPALSVDTTYPDPLYTYEQGDTVFFWNPYKSKFSATYFWGAKIGDTLTYEDPRQFHCPCDSVYKYLVEDTGSIILNGFYLRTYSIKLINFNCSFLYPETVKFTERLGSLSAIKPYHICVTDDDEFSLRCYKDDSFTVYQTNPDITCDYIFVGINEKDSETNYAIYPNPTNTKIYLNNDGIIEYEILNVLGKKVQKETLYPIQSISVFNLNDGIYFLQITNLKTPNKPLTILKFIKH